VTSDFAHREGPAAVPAGEGRAAERIRARCQQVVEAAESGVALPHDGRLVDGDAAAA
jgi:hypothetical protein